MTQKDIISRLLDKYEKSKHLYEPGSTSRRVMLRIEKNELPEYQYENAEIRDRGNAAAMELEKCGLIAIEWLKGRPVMSSVILNLSNVLDCYAFIGRLHPKEYASTVGRLIESELQDISTTWICAWRDEQYTEAMQSYKVPSFCKDDLVLLRSLVSALKAYDSLHGETITMRAFSTRVYHDTKFFERNVRDLFLKIALKYHQEFSECNAQEKLGAREQLAFLGIYARPELYEFSGNIAIETECGRISLSPVVPYGIGIPSTLVDSILNIDLSQIKKVTFIENKTNYDEYLVTELDSDELAIYHGGFESPQKRKLFAKLAEAIDSQTEVYFWADIDLGGFQMFSQLQRIIPQVLPMRMSENDVISHFSHGLSRTNDYLERLRNYQKDNPDSLFSGVINLLLQYQVTIEQEAFLL